MKLSKNERKALIESLSGEGRIEFGGNSREKPSVVAKRKPAPKPAPKPETKQERQEREFKARHELAPLEDKTFFDLQVEIDTDMRNALVAADHHGRKRYAPRASWKVR